MGSNIQGLPQLLRQLDETLGRIEILVEEQTQATAQAIAATAQDLAPVQSGRLRDSIRVVRESGGFYKVGTDVPYAAAKELGLRRGAPAKPFLFPAYLLHKDQLLDNLKTALRQG